MRDPKLPKLPPSARPAPPEDRSQAMARFERMAKLAVESLGNDDLAMAAWRLAVSLDRAAAAEGQPAEYAAQLEKELGWSIERHWTPRK